MLFGDNSLQYAKYFTTLISTADDNYIELPAARP